MTLSLNKELPKWRQFYILTKPRVTQLAVFCAVIGMFLATPGMVPWRILLGGLIRNYLIGKCGFCGQLPD